jgi:tRNA A37 methylthiotransferase MiaB
MADGLADCPISTSLSSTPRPSVLKAMKRPANEAKVLERIQTLAGAYVQTSPSARRSSSAFPVRRKADFQYLLDWLDEAQLDRVGAFRFEPVEGAPANALPDPVPEDGQGRTLRKDHGKDRRDHLPQSLRPRSAACCR